MAFTIEISDTSADALVVDILRNSLESIKMDVDRLMTKSDLVKFEKEDLNQALIMRTHMHEVLKYYLPHDKWATI
jgi:hypothetical protein